MSNLMLTSGAPVPDHTSTADFFSAVGKELNHVHEYEVLAAYLRGPACYAFNLRIPKTACTAVMFKAGMAKAGLEADFMT
eukprot:5046599-Pleurochrysis_carterae.AAC.1